MNRPHNRAIASGDKFRCDPTAGDTPLYVQDSKNPSRLKFCRGKFKGAWLGDIADAKYLRFIIEKAKLSGSARKAITTRLRSL